MAIEINRVYQKVLAIANKEQRGYITPQEFNLFADKAQMEIFGLYFHQVNNAERKPKNQMLYSDIVEMTEEKLHPFHVDTTVNVDATGVLTLPSDVHKLISITRANGTILNPVNKTEINYIDNNPLTKPTLKRSVFVREDVNSLTIFPAPTSSTFNVSTDVTNDSPSTTFEAEGFEVSYYKRPTPPNWAYVLAGGNKALYNASATDLQDFELHSSEEEEVVSRILVSAGVMMKQPDVQQSGLQDIQLNKSLENS